MFSALGSNFSGLKRSKAKLYRPCNQFDILWYFDMLTCLVTVSMSCVCTVHEVTWLTFQKWRKKNLASHHKECRTESHCNNDSGLLSLLLSELVTAGDTWAWHPLLHSFCHNADQCTWVQWVQSLLSLRQECLMLFFYQFTLQSRSCILGIEASPGFE